MLLRYVDLDLEDVETTTATTMTAAKATFQADAEDDVSGLVRAAGEALRHLGKGDRLVYPAG